MRKMSFKYILVNFLLFNHFFVNADWREYSNPNGPRRDGILVGLNEYGKESYVGRGTYNGQLAPGKLMIERHGYAAGLYFAYGGREHLITSGVEYYVRDPWCEYLIWVRSSYGQFVQNAVQFRSSPFTFYVGRTTSFGSIQVGKVTLEHQVMYYAFGGREHTSSSYEVLVCGHSNVS